MNTPAPKRHTFDYWPRSMVNSRLRFSLWQSYRFVPVTPSGRIRSDKVYELLNRSRRGMVKPVTCLPHDLVKLEEVATHLSHLNVTTEEVKRWIKRGRAMPPHFYITRNHILFSVSALENWIAENSLPHDRRRTA